MVSKDGSVAPYEVLRPCLAEDFPRLGRLNEITDPSLPSSASERRLIWTENTAELSSSQGKARFVALR